MSRIDDYSMLAAEALRESIGSIERAAGEAGAVAQCDDAERFAWLDGVAICLEPILRTMILECAKTCEGRTIGREISSATNEATKCAMQIRHNMLCYSGESTCLHCDGERCERCNFTGVYGTRQTA